MDNMLYMMMAKVVNFNIGPVWHTPAVQCTLVPECRQLLIVPPVQVDANNEAKRNQDIDPVLPHQRRKFHHDAWEESEQRDYVRKIPFLQLLSHNF